MKIIAKLFATDRKSTMAAYRKGISHFNKLQYAEAIPYFEQVIAKKNLGHSIEAKLAHFYCGQAHINVGVTHFAKNENQKALSHFQEALRFQPDDTDLDYFIGICLNNIGDYKGAMASFSKISGNRTLEYSDQA